MLNISTRNNLEFIYYFSRIFKLHRKNGFPCACVSSSRLVHLIPTGLSRTIENYLKPNNILQNVNLLERTCRTWNCCFSSGAVSFKLGKCGDDQWKKSDDGNVSLTNGEECDNINKVRNSLVHRPKEDIKRLLNKFFDRPLVKELTERCGLEGNLINKVFISFHKYCLESEELPAELHSTLTDQLNDSGETDDLFPYFLSHVKVMFPQLNYIEELKQLSDFRRPMEWCVEAREKPRKVIYHAGPTNSGKTHHALQRFTSAKSGVYCGPLRLLACEVFKKSNALGTKCDLITGEDRRFMDDSGEPSAHRACTVEMTDLNQPVEVAVIDEIQMVRDLQRGWAWTRAFLGVRADEIHVCGEEAGVDLIKDLATSCGDSFEVRTYQRLTKLDVLSQSIETFDAVKPGDCIVCFNKNDIFYICKQLERRGVEVAVIYGSLPIGTKLGQAEKFNDPNNTCKVLVATDAVGMGLNLHIKRVIFYSITKPSPNGEHRDFISPSAALQVAGRAGRFLTQFEIGEVTTFKADDLPMLTELLSTSIPPIQKAGLAPSLEQIELFKLCLPKTSLFNLIDIFTRLCETDEDKYFLCKMENFLHLAKQVEHVPLQLKAMYVFCSAPISKKQLLASTMLVKFATQFSKGHILTTEWVCQQVGWVFKAPQTTKDLSRLEGIYDVFDLYLWLSYHFPDLFPDVDCIKEKQEELEKAIQLGIANIVKLIDDVSAANSGCNRFESDSYDLPNSTGHSQMISTQYAANNSGPTPHQKQQLQNGSSLSKRFLTAMGKQTELDKKKVESFLSSTFKPGEKVSHQLIQQSILTKSFMEKLREDILRNMSKDDPISTLSNASSTTPVGDIGKCKSTPKKSNVRKKPSKKKVK